MPELDFQIESVQAAPYAASPQLLFKLRLAESPPRLDQPSAIQSVMLQCQIRLEPARRKYQPAEQERLFDLFAETQRWGQTVRSLLWTHVTLIVPPFETETRVDLPVACTYDFNLAAAKYFDALEGGHVPLTFLFSGSIFHSDSGGALQVQQISWEKETSFQLPIATWRQMMDIYYPNSAWLCLRRDVFDRLCQFKRRRGLALWEQAIDALLNEAPERTVP